MAFLDSPEGWSFSLTEWWDLEGDYHGSTPSEEDLLNASQVTGHFTDPEYDDDMYVTFISEDGWTYEELEGEFTDWYQEGTE